eukprot:c37467_g1_i1 orf=193-885(+)
MASFAKASMSSSMFVIISLIIICLNQLAVILVEASDPDPVADYVAEAKSFVIRDIFKHGEILNDTGGVRAALTTDNFPAITTQGITYVRVRIVPCGCTLAHSHPRATEIMTLISGGPLQVGFIDTKGDAHIEILYPGDVTLFPRGLLHFELNVGDEVADYLSALNSQDPGTLTSASALFKIPKRALASSLNLPWHFLESINSTISQSTGPSIQKVARSDCVPGQDVTTNI